MPTKPKITTGADTVIVHYPASAWPYTGINGLTAKESILNQAVKQPV
jgi:hypothetical protein